MSSTGPRDPLRESLSSAEGRAVRAQGTGFPGPQSGAWGADRSLRWATSIDRHAGLGPAEAAVRREQACLRAPSLLSPDVDRVRTVRAGGELA